MNLSVLWDRLSEVIFPRSPEAQIVHDIRSETMLHIYAPQMCGDIYALSSYKDTRMRALIHEAKFHNNSQAFKLLHVLLQLHMKSSLENIDYILPIPLSRERMRLRGYNQVLKVLACTKDDLSEKVLSGVLVRHRHTQPQTELARQERLLNIQNAFQVKDSDKIAKKNIVIIDDVTTTGATLEAAKSAILPHVPKSVKLIALTH